MSLKAGRRGLHKSLVDAFGFLKGEMPTGEYYTKTQTDNKFETKTHANNTFQKQTLEVPIEMLYGTKLTVEDALQGLNEEKFTYADNGVLGTKNLLSNNATTQTINGVTFTVNSDGSVTANGTATANIDFVLEPNTEKYNGKELKLSGCTGGSDSTYWLFMRVGDSSDVFVRTINNYGGDTDITLSLAPSGTQHARVGIHIVNGQTISNRTFYPMLRIATDPDDTYVPYAMTNREITEELAIKESAVTDIIEGASVLEDENYVLKYGKIVTLDISLRGVTATAHTDAVFRIPEGYRPKFLIEVDTVVGSVTGYIPPNGIYRLRNDMTDGTIRLHATWLTD